MLLAEILSKDYQISIFLGCLLSIVNIENSFIAFGLILELGMLSLRLLIIVIILSFIRSWIYFIANALNLLPLFNVFRTSKKFEDFIKE